MNKLIRNKWLFLSVLCFSIITLTLSLCSCGGGGGGGDGNGGTPTNSVWGHALLPDSNDHSGITVSLEGTSYSTTTDAAGYYYISGFPDGTYYIIASKSGYTDARSGPWSFSNTHHENVDLTLGGGAGELKLDPPGADGSVSGSYTPYGGEVLVRFSATVTGDGKAQAMYKVEGGSEEITAQISSQDKGEIKWNGLTIDGYGALSDQEAVALNKLATSKLAKSLAMIPLELGCKGNNIDPAAMEALLMPWQMILKYLSTDILTDTHHCADVSTCRYFTDPSNPNDNRPLPSVIALSESTPVPFVFGYFPFDATGSMESQSQKTLHNTIERQSQKTLQDMFTHITGLTCEDMPGLTFTDITGANKLSFCRGACGIDCNGLNCTVTTSEWRCVKPDEINNNGYKANWTQHHCDTHEVCRWHDKCYDDCTDANIDKYWPAAVCRHTVCDMLVLSQYEEIIALLWMFGIPGELCDRRDTYEYINWSTYTEDPAICPTSPQPPMECTFSINPPDASFSSGGGTGGVNVYTGDDCTWGAISNASWIYIYGATGIGNGRVSYSVYQNTSTESRTGTITITIAGQTFTVYQAGAPPEPTEMFDVKISSLTCDWTVKIDDYGVKSDCVRSIAKGTALGPVGARLELPILVWSTDKFDCGAWTHKTGALIAVGHTCVREEGQPETTTWTVDTEGDECPFKNYFNNNISYSVKIYKDDNLYPEKDDRKDTLCQ